MAAEIVDVLLRARMEASGVEAGVGQIQKSLKGLTLPKGISDDLEKSFSKLVPLLKDYQKQLNKGFSNKKDLQNFNALKEKISETFSEIRGQVQSVNSQEVRLKVDTQEIDKLENKIVSKTADLQKALNNVFTKSINTNNIKEQLDKVIGNTTKAATIKPMADAAKKLFNAQDYAAYNNKIDELKNKILSLKTTKVDLATALGVKDAAKNLDLANDKIEKFFNGLKVNEGKVQTIEHLRQELKDLGINLENVKLDSLTKGVNELQGVDSLIEQLASSLRETGNAAGDAGQGMVRMVDEVNELKSSTQYFFSLRNMINLLKRGIDEAVQSVKDLDKAMTETAVVTDFSVADMWKNLPKYTQIANELGATTQGAYETMTLYYQQGLDQQQAFALGAETMKMARIAGLDYAETTDMMTAALRGFNMELNETSAKRVNDVYSELAAITASNTEELGTAMQRTASIAASAGASFEGTTAFLAQAIETTREPAENIGTAMKTIIARFQEMKKNPLEISEVDGEEVDYNKIDAALKTIGVDLKDTNGQFREFDQVMLDISARWDGLSQAQQRYIATTAAGSRQQSRFIAMVSNYDRTMQLMEAANNSAGASDEQFGKTMDSLEAKLNKLHNAWQQFTMGIMNNNMVKGIVDAGTSVLTIVNKIIDVLSFNGQFGLIKSLLSLTTAFTALKGGGKIINSLIGGLGGLVDPQSSFKEGLKGGFLGGRNQLQADRISSPIVKAIYSLIPHIDASVKSEGPYKFQEAGNYKNARQMLSQDVFDNKGNYTPGRLLHTLTGNELNKEQQAAFFQASPGLKKNLTQSMASLFKEIGLDSDVRKGLIQGFSSGNLALDEAFEKAGLYTTYSEQLAKIGKEQGPEAATEFVKSYGMNLRKRGEDMGLSGDALQSYINNYKMPTDELQKFLQTPQQLTTLQKVQNGLGQIGAGLMSAGSTLQMFGSTLSETNPILGQFVSGLGNTLTTMGSLANTIPALMNPWTLAIGAIGAAIALEQARLSNIKKSAEEVSKSFEETNKTTQENIASLKSYQSELATLSKGVDINGNNVNLSGAEYERYLEIVDEIATLNPEIVQGYNAQGHAIINNNKALDETIAKQEELQKKSLNDYIDSTSLQKLINARNINKDYITGTAYKTQAKGTFVGGESSIITTNSKAPMANAVRDLVKEFDKQKGLDIDSILQGYGISLEQLQAGEEKAINTFVKNQDQINAQVGAAIATSGEEINESLTESFDKLSEQTANFDAAIAPVLQNLQTYVSNTSAFKNIAPEFQSALMSGLKDIVIQPDLDAEGMQEQARILVQEFDNLSAEGSDYANAMKEVENAQNQFAESLDASEYTKNTENALRTLDSLMSQYAGKTDAYSQAIAEYLQTQMDKIRGFTTDSGISLSQAFNGVSDTLAAAEGAYSSFQESTKTDLATGKDSMKSIFDEVTKETDGVALHMQKFGDGAFWKGARSLLGDKFVDENAEDVDKIKKAIQSLEPELKAGEEGFAAFWENFQQVSDKDISGFTWNEDGSYDIDRNVNPEVYKEIADAMHRSEEYVVAMLNAGKQFADIDFHNVDDVRKALATDTATIKNGEQIFVKSDYYNSALDEAHIFNPNERQNIKDQDAAAGVIEIKNPDQITKDDFRAMGITNLPSLIKSFGDTGLFNRDEIIEYAEALGNSGLIDYNPEDFEADYQRYLDSQDHPELQPIQSIESTVQQIAGLIEKKNILEGNYSQQEEDTAQALYDSVIGGKGTDTATQYFGEGKNEGGNRLLSPKEFVDTYANLGKMAAEAEEKANTYYQGAKAAEEKGDTESAEKLNKIGDLYTAIQKSALANQQEGKQTWVDEYARQAYESKLKDLENSGLDDAAIKAEAAKVWQSAFDEAQAAVNAAEGKEGTNQEISQAVQEQAKALSQSNASNEQIKASMVDAANKMADAQMKPGEIALELNKAYGTNLTDKDVNIGKKGVDLTLDESKLQEQLSNLHADVQANITSVSMGGHAARASGQNNPNSVFHRHGTMARGSRRGYIIPGRPTLTGEEGEELVWEPKRNEAYMVGSNGPQFANISKDAVVWNAAQTKRIKKNSKVGNFGTGAKGISNFGTMAGGNGGGLKIPGVLDLDAKATIQDVALPEKEFTIPVKADLQNKTTLDNVEASAVVTQVTKATQVAGEPIQVKATATTTSVKNEAPAQKPKAEGQTMKVSADTSAAQSKINKLIKLFNKTYTLKYKASGPSSIKVPISANFTGPWQKTVTINKSGAKGINNRIGHYSTPTFNSAAKGYGQLGPKGKGGLTLTGEKGFEIAWLPSESRSMILGANGPQMLNLPSDAVVYTHKQSKEILKRKGISAGSMDRGIYKPSTPTSTSNNDTKKNNSDTKKNNKDTSKNNKKAEEVINKAGRLSVWWENMARRVDATQRNVDKTASKFEKIIQGGGKSSTRANADAIGKEYAANLNKIISLSNDQITKATQELKDLDKNKASKKQSGKKKQYNKGAENIAQISYTNKKGKSKQKFVNIGQYIKEQDGTYVVDEAKIKKNVKDPGERQAIADAANKELNDKLQKLYNAEDALAKAQEALEKMADDTYEAFDQWDKTITQVYLLGQRLEQLAKQQSVYEAAFDTEISRLTAGFGNTFSSVERINSALTHSQDMILSQVNGQSELIDDTFKEYKDLLDLNTYYEKTIKSHSGSTKAKEDYEIMKETLNFLKSIGITDMNNFDYTSTVQQLENQNYSQNAYDKIKNGLDKIHDTQEAYYSSIEDSYKLVNDLYGLMNEYESFISEFEQNLLEGIEDQTKNEIDKLDKLSSALSKAYKDLLDEVKKRLDERRQKEDNQKTESDISKKQQRLAMLQADTSGGHQVEIAQLQKEIAEARQNYQRSLEDQLLEKLQNQADIAEKQRERQIELLEGQIEIASQLGTNLEEVKQWLQDPRANYESIRQAYFAKNNYDTATPGEQEKIRNQFEADFAKYLGYSEQIKYLKSLDDHLLEILHKADDQAGITHLLQDKEQIQSKLNTTRQKAEQELQTSGEVSTETQKEVDDLQQRLTSVETAIQAKSNIPTDNSNTITQTSTIKEPNVIDTSAAEQAENARKAEEARKAAAAAQAEAQRKAAIDKQNKINAYNNYMAARKKDKKINSAQINQLFTLGSAIGKGKATVLLDIVGGKGADPFTWEKQMKAILGASGINRWNLLKTFPNNESMKKALTKYLNKTLSQIKSGDSWKNAKALAFKTGGLADYTGPAWLDGTPSKPELVLNARDTQNFLALRDVLSKVIGSTNSITNSYGGDNIFEINVNVDKIEKDYDVDRVIEKVKKEITKGAGYRNVTQVRNFR